MAEVRKEAQNTAATEISEDSKSSTASGQMPEKVKQTQPAKKSVGLNYSKWDKIVKDLEEEDKDDEKTENDILKVLYAGADEATRRAMNKSYSESGGKVLSMNWDEVSKKKVVYDADDDD